MITCSLRAALIRSSVSPSFSHKEIAFGIFLPGMWFSVWGKTLRCLLLMRSLFCFVSWDSTACLTYQFSDVFNVYCIRYLNVVGCPFYIYAQSVDPWRLLCIINKTLHPQATSTSPYNTIQINPRYPWPHHHPHQSSVSSKTPYHLRSPDRKHSINRSR